jgi:ATP-dependent DNA helicase RecG
MVRSSDGFEIAEVDLQLRGPGDLMGTQQSGLLNLKIADLAKDSQLVILARDAARAILEKDPNLILPEYAQIRSILVDVLKTKPDWGKIA